MSTGEYIEVERYRRDPPPADLESALAVIKRLLQRGANLAIEGRSPRTKHAPTNMIIRCGVGRDEWTGELDLTIAGTLANLVKSHHQKKGGEVVVAGDRSNQFGRWRTDVISIGCYSTA